jgi:hypothetical protein
VDVQAAARLLGKGLGHEGRHDTHGLRDALDDADIEAQKRAREAD